MTKGDQDADRPEIDISKAQTMWTTFVDLIAKRDGVSVSKAIDAALRDKTGRELFDLQRDLYLTKMGEGLGFEPGEGHGASSNQATIDPHDSVRHEVEVDDGEAFRTYSAAVKEAAQHMSTSDAHDYVRKAFPKLWAKVKTLKGDVPLNAPGSHSDDGRSPMMLPTSHDGNALRPSGTDFDEANRREARSGGRPYRAHP